MLEQLEMDLGLQTKLLDGTSGDVALEGKMLETLLECFLLWKIRHRKYGRGNIAEFGAVGCLIRSSDKKARLREHYLGNGSPAPEETVEDSWKDAVNYAAMGLMCERGQWPGVPRIA